MVKKVLRSAEKFSEPFPLSPLPLYLSPIFEASRSASTKPLLPKNCLPSQGVLETSSPLASAIVLDVVRMRFGYGSDVVRMRFGCGSGVVSSDMFSDRV